MFGVVVTVDVFAVMVLGLVETLFSTPVQRFETVVVVVVVVVDVEVVDVVVVDVVVVVVIVVTTMHSELRWAANGW